MISTSLIASTPNASASAVISTSGTSPYITAYQWSNTGGFGTKFSDPASGMGAAGRNALNFNKSRTAVGAGQAGSPWFYAWKWNRKTGWGDRYTNMSDIPSVSVANGLDFSKDGKAIAVAANLNSPYIWTYTWNNDTGWGTKFANPGTASPNDVRHCVFHPKSNYLLLTGGTAPRAGIWAFDTSSGFGAKLTAPATLPTSVANQAAWSKSGDAIVFASDSSPYLHAYPFTGSAWGTKFSNPGSAALPSQFGAGCQFNSLDNVVFVTGVLNSSSPQISAFKFTKSGGFGTKFANPSTILSNTPAGFCNLTPDDAAFVFPSSASPYIIAYKWNNVTGWGTKYSDPSSLPAGGGSTKAIFV